MPENAELKVMYCYVSANNPDLACAASAQQDEARMSAVDSTASPGWHSLQTACGGRVFHNTLLSSRRAATNGLACFCDLLVYHIVQPVIVRGCSQPCARIPFGDPSLASGISDTTYELIFACIKRSWLPFRKTRPVDGSGLLVEPRCAPGPGMLPSFTYP